MIYKRLKEILLVFFTVLLMTTGVQAQSMLVNGVVIDAENGQTLPGVNIAVKGTTQSASTDAEDTSGLGVPSASNTFIFSFIGYQTCEIAIQGRFDLGEITLQPRAKVISNVLADLDGVAPDIPLESEISDMLEEIRRERTVELAWDGV